VVLQEQSVTPIYDPDRFARYAGLFCGRARAAGAEPLLFLTWARRYAPEMQDRLTEAYMRAARRSGARVAPVGEAWRRALAGRRGLVLHTPDASHPNRAGSYLAACVFHATIHARSPVGLPGRLSAGGRGRRRDVLVSLKKSDAAFLQRAAWGAVKAFAPRER